MTLKVLKQAIVTDDQDSTAQDIINWNTDVTFSNGVPVWLYTSLATMCSSYLAQTGVGTLNNFVHYEYGAGTAKNMGIFLQQKRIADMPEILQTDDVKTERLTCCILVKLPRNNSAQNQSQYELVVNVGLRLKYILDTRCRELENNQYMRLNSPNLLDPDTSVDNSIHPDSPYKIQFLWSEDPTATEQEHYILVEFDRAFV